MAYLSWRGFNWSRAKVAAVLSFVVLSIGLSLVSHNALATNSLITVYVDGEERAISTSVQTVSEALERAQIELNSNDLVEPGLDTFINDSTFRINVYRARPVTIVDEGKMHTVMSPYDTPKLIAESVGIEVYPEDRYEIELIDDILTAGAIGERIIIDRATPVTLRLYGESVQHRTHAETVGDVLGEAGVAIAEDDELVNNPQEKIGSSTVIDIVRKGTEVVTDRVSIARPIEYIYDNNMFNGQTEIDVEGADGVEVVTYEIQLENDHEVSRRVLQSVVESQPVAQVQRVGTKVADIGSNAALGQQIAASRGWTGGEWQCLYSLWQKESNWNHLAQNPSSGAYGIPQSLPGSKMATVGSDWQTNPSTQINWGLNYIAGRYGTPCGAWGHSVSHNWY